MIEWLQLAGGALLLYPAHSADQLADLFSGMLLACSAGRMV
jgi:hypothetical protein